MDNMDKRFFKIHVNDADPIFTDITKGNRGYLANEAPGNGEIGKFVHSVSQESFDSAEISDTLDFSDKRENHLETAEKSTEQNYNMIDEQINNEPPQDYISVLIVEPLQEPYVKEIPNTLKSLQREVGGTIQTLYPFAEDAAIVCNDNAKLEGLGLNRALFDEDGDIYDIIAGKFMVVGLGEEDFASLPPELMDKMRDRFKHPEIFAKINGEIKVIHVKPSIKTLLDNLQKEQRKVTEPKREPPKHEL